MTTTTFDVTGMTCSHCANSVTTELTKVNGVSGVQVDVASGRVTVTSDAPVDTAAVEQAVVEAGYELASA
ncbi:MAG: heavy-metal-associated domain-containing protein [Actinomycetales bacterium]